jgi:hypothetical protein
MKTYGGEEVNLGASWGLVVSFTSRPLYPEETTSGTHLIGCSVDPRAGLNEVQKEKFRALVIQPVA